MARGVRRSQREKLEEKLVSVEEAITRYGECLEKLKNEKKRLRKNWSGWKLRSSQQF